MSELFFNVVDMLRLLAWLALSLTLAPLFGLALAGWCGAGARAAALAPALGLFASAAIGAPLLFVLPGLAGTLAPWAVIGALFAGILALRGHLLGGAPLAPAPPAARYPAETLATLAIFLLLGTLLVLALRVPVAANASSMETLFAAKVLSAGAWISREASDLLPGIPGSPLVAALAALMGRAAGAFDERLLALASFSGYCAALWIVWMEVRRRPVEGGVFVIALVALLPGQLADTHAGAVSGGESALLAPLFACIALLLEEREGESPARRYFLAALLACLVPFLGRQGWALLLVLSAGVSVRAGARAAPLWAGSLLLFLPLTAVGAAELLSPGVATKLLPVTAQSPQLWHGPRGALAFGQALLLRPGEASALVWALLFGAGAMALFPRGQRGTASPWLLLAPCALYVPLCAMAPGLAGSAELIQQRLLEIAPVAALCLHRLMLRAGMGLADAPLLERLAGAPGIRYEGTGV